MYSLLTLLCLVFMVMWPAIANIFAYPVSKKLSLKISDYIVNVCAPRLFAILKNDFLFRTSSKDPLDLNIGI